MISTYWKLSAEKIAAHGGFTDVVRKVHWQCFATQGPGRVRLYGAIALPLPTDPASYIDLASIRAMDDAARRATILGWAEMIEPGFVAATEARAIARLKADLAAPASETLAIL